MGERQDELVRVDGTGAAHPVGKKASRAMRERQGSMRRMPSPGHVLIMRDEANNARAPRPGVPQPGTFWMAGEITRPGALWDVIAMIGQGNWDGELVVEGEAARSLFFQRGAIIGASSTAERERLGEVLYQYGALSEEQVQVVVDAMTPNVRFGEAAVAMGFISNEKLFEMVSKQTEEVVYAAMLVSAGAFYFVDELDEQRLPYRLNLAVTSLLMEGVRRMDEMECFRARIPSSMHVPERMPDATIDSGHEHEAVFRAVDGARSCDDIGRAVGFGPFDTTRALFQLLQAGLISIHPPRPTGPEAIVTLFNQAMQLVLAEVDACGGGGDVRDQLASFATASGVYDALFNAAGPRADGTVDAERVSESAQILVGPEQSTDMLSQWLFEYASFAMFISEPILRASSSGDAGAVSRQVADLISPLAPEA